MVEVGDKIRILYMDDPNGLDYIGREGVVQRVCTDPWGERRLEGTWGIALYPRYDKFEIIEKGNANDKE